MNRDLGAMLMVAETLRLLSQIETSNVEVTVFTVDDLPGNNDIIDQLFETQETKEVPMEERATRQRQLDEVSPENTLYSPSTTICTICNDYPESSNRVLPCGHEFCSGCIVNWITRYSREPTCPVCRDSIVN